MSVEEVSDQDSALGDDNYESSTQSLTSSVLNYQYENGRRYHAFREGQYFMPNDDQEQEGMDLMHHISRMILGGDLCRAPIQNPLDILDIGTGTGIWAIDMADEFPEAYIVATDLSPIQPQWVPANLQFEVDDCESEWNFQKEFDFIHIRNLGAAISDWPKLLQRCFEHLKPGGWIECSNIEIWGRSANNALSMKNPSVQWQMHLRTAASMLGRQWNPGPRFEQLIREAGFKNVKDDQYKVPMSPWMPGRRNKELSFFFQNLVLMELEALSLRLYTQVLNWTAEELQVLLVGVRQDIRNPAHQIFSTMHYVTGQKI